MSEARSPRSYRRNVDEDIRRGEQAVRDAEAEVRSNDRMRRLFGGNSSSRGLGNLGRMDSEMEGAPRRLRGVEDELNSAREYRRQYPDEQPVGSPGRPSLVYKNGGVVKKMAAGGKVRGCGIAKRGHTKGRVR